jgi:predicted phage tail protein
MNKLTKYKGRGGDSGKGGGGSSRVPVEQSDNLRSIQFARVLDLVCEGEIFGLVNGMKSVFLDDTPVQNTDDSFNFTGISIATANGTQSQGHIAGFSDTEAETIVGINVTVANSVTRTVTNTSIDAVRVTVATPRLTTVNTKNGDTTGGSINYAIDLQENGGGFVEVINDTISGKTTTLYQRAFKIALPVGGNPWDIRVRRITPDNEKSNIANLLSWTSYTEIIDEKFAYPNSAVIGLEVDSKQFKRIPKRSYELKLLKIKIPVNYDPITRVYDGVWDGTFKTDWTDNPAWAFYDLVTEPRYGLGDFVDATQIDKFTLYTISQYCDTLVDDGFGGTEPRFTINIYFQTRDEAYRVLSNLASVFRGMMYWAGGQLVAIQDKPETPVYQFTDANVENGLFNYQGTSKSARHTVALVTWNDPAQRYEPRVEYVEDGAGIIRFGVNQVEIVAIGVTSRGQANRVGRWVLLSERLETESCSFIAGLEGSSIQPGNIIDIMDSKRAGIRGGGRLASVTSTTIVVLDADVTLEAAKTYELQIILPDGTMEEQTVTTAPSTTNTLTVDTPFTILPVAQSIWLLTTDNLVRQTFRVLSISEIGKNKHEVVCIEHDTTKFAQVDTGILLETSPTDESVVLIAAPVNISLGEYTFQDRGETVTVMTIDWDATPQAVEYFIKYKPLNGNFIGLDAPVTASYAEVVVPGPDIYTIEVIASNSIGNRSLPTLFTGSILGRDDVVPERVTGLRLFGAGNGTEFFGKDAKFEWRDQSEFSLFELGEEPQGAGDGAVDPFFKDYEVRILKDGVLLRVAHTTDPTYTYTFENNAEDFGISNPGQSGANRTFTIEVYARGKQNQISAHKTTITVSNPPPALHSNVFYRASDNVIFLSFDEPEEIDFAGTEVYISPTTPFTPGPSNLHTVSRDYGISIDDRDPDTDYYVVYRPFDSFGRVGLNESGEVLQRTSLNLADIAVNSITADKYLELRNSQLLWFDDSLDSSVPFEIFFPISSEMIAIKRVALTFKIKNYRALSKTALSGGGSTSGSGGAETPTSSSGGAATPTSAGGGNSAHAHSYAIPGRPVLQTFSAIKYSAGTLRASGGGTIIVGDHSYTITNSTTGNQVYVDGSTGGMRCSGGGTITSNTYDGHSHTTTLASGTSGNNDRVGFLNGTLICDFSSGQMNTNSSGSGTSAHTHTVTLSNHTHTVTTTNHTHSTPNHTHDIDFGITEVVNTSPSIGVFVDNGSGFGSDLGPFTADQLEFDLTSEFSGTGNKVLKFTANKLFRIVGVLELKLDLNA